MFEILDEIIINDNENIKVFDIIKKNECYLVPYNFKNYFIPNLTFNNFTNYCLYLLKYKILKEEIEYLKKYYSKVKIKDNKRLLYYIDNIDRPKYNEIIHSLIINKRFEYLLEYIQNNKFNIEYIDYIKTQMKSLYKTTKYLINK